MPTMKKENKRQVARCASMPTILDFFQRSGSGGRAHERVLRGQVRAGEFSPPKANVPYASAVDSRIPASLDLSGRV